MKKYVKTMEKIHAPQEQIDRALDNVYQNKLIEMKPNKTFKYKAIGGLAAAMAVVVGVSAFAFRGGSHSSGFTITANAAEITAGDFVQVGSLNRVGSGASTEWDKEYHVLSLGFDKDFDFNISCQGEGIETITYTLSDGAYFGLEPDAAGVTNTVAYTNTSRSVLDRKFLLVTSYTVEAKSDVVPALTFHVAEDEGKYCKIMEDRQIITTDENGINCVQSWVLTEDICCEMFREYNHADLNVTATYKDGRTETQKVIFEFEEGTMLEQEYDETEPGEHKVVEVKAKIEK